MSNKADIFKKNLNGKRVALVGYGVSNRAAARFLSKAGAVVTAYDALAPSEDALASMRAQNIDFVQTGDFSRVEADMVLRSPGIRPDAIGGAGELTSEAEIFVALCPCPIYAVTGSDGKTTTTTIISKLLEAEYKDTGRRVFLGGNIGEPLIERLDDIKENDVCVMELSSFQLMTMRFSPRVAVVTNISPNHLNWHKSMEEYICAKRRIFEFQSKNSRLVTNADNEVTSKFVADARGETRLFSSHGDGNANIRGGAVYLGDEKITNLSDIRLPGIHNAENFMAAFLAVDGEASKENMRFTAQNFNGVRHRLETVCQRRGVRFINSSIDTSPSRTAAALSSFSEKVILIIGGYDKHIPLTPMVEPIKSHAKAVFCTGDTGRSVFEALMSAGYEGEIRFIPEFDAAVFAAVRSARSGDVVLLSPAAASFDAFKNFEARGERFSNIVKNINV